MRDSLQVWIAGRSEMAELVGTRVTIGRGKSNDVVVDEPTVSTLHALVERLGDRWVVRDLASRNGTFVNGDRLWGDRPLHGGDEIRIGGARLLFRTDAVDDATTEIADEVPPRLTTREHEVLVALCRPLLAGNLFTDPATVHEVAEELVVSDTAVKQHLARLYDKFGVFGDRRRVELANRAVRTGAVSLNDLTT